MKHLFVILVICGSVVSVSAKQRPNTAVGGVVAVYELYSWQDAQGAWNFSVLFNTNRQKMPEEVLNAKAALHGVNQLCRAIARRPRSSRIEWFDELTLKGVKLKGSEGLAYPPKDIVDEVRSCADARAIEILGPEK